jgi:5'-3' exonuclease
MGRSPWRRERVQGLAPIRRARQLRAVMRIHLVDGTYELFRAYYGAPKATAPDGSEVGATRGLLRSLLSLLREDGVTHVACAFDHVIESFRNDLFAGYKTGEGVEADLLAQFPLAERAVHALGLVVWPMVEFETDDALATAAARADAEPGVEQVIICSPDKDLTQCVRGTRVVCLDRLRRRIYDEAAVREKFGVTPGSIPDWLALVGDSADGVPGVPRWGARSASTVLARYPHLELIPDRETEWEVTVRGAAALASSLREHREDAVLYRRLTTLRVDVPLQEAPRDLRWEGADRDALTALCRAIGDDELLSRVSRWR